MQVTGAGRAAFPLRAAAALVLRRRSAAISRDACHGGRVSIMDKMRGRGSRADVLGFSSFLPVGKRAFSCRLLGRWFFACGLISRGIDAPLILRQVDFLALFSRCRYAAGVLYSKGFGLPSLGGAVVFRAISCRVPFHDGGDLLGDFARR